MKMNCRADGQHEHNLSLAIRYGDLYIWSLAASHYQHTIFTPPPFQWWSQTQGFKPGTAPRPPALCPALPCALPRAPRPSVLRAPRPSPRPPLIKRVIDNVYNDYVSSQYD